MVVSSRIPLPKVFTQDGDVKQNPWVGEFVFKVDAILQPVNMLMASD